MTWRIEIDEAAKKDLSRLDKSTAKRITGFLRERVATLEDPRSIGEALKGPRLGAYWKYRVGDHRIVCDIQDEAISILVIRIGHRREVYR